MASLALGFRCGIEINFVEGLNHILNYLGQHLRNEGLPVLTSKHHKRNCFTIEALITEKLAKDVI